MNQDRAYLIYILECITSIEELTAQGRASFETAKHPRAAALYYLQTMAESTQRLSEALKAANPNVDWLAISGFRNRLVHGYMNVNPDILWSVIENSVPELKQAVLVMLENLIDSENEHTEDQ